MTLVLIVIVADLALYGVRKFIVGQETDFEIVARRLRSVRHG